MTPNLSLVIARTTVMQGIRYARQNGENDKPLIKILEKELGMKLNEKTLRGATPKKFDADEYVKLKQDIEFEDMASKE